MSDRNPRNRAPPQRRPDPVRRLAYQVIRQVNGEDGYANLALNKALREQRLGGRDAAFATELVHGTLRWQGTYDAFLARSVSRPLADLDPELLDLLRLGTHQLLRMRVDSYAAVSEIVTLARSAVGQSRPVSSTPYSARSASAPWSSGSPRSPLIPTKTAGHLAIAKSHPRWVIDAFGAASRATRTSWRHCSTPTTSRPGDVGGATRARRGRRARRRRSHAYPLVAVRRCPAGGGDPGRIAAVARGRAGVQDEGSQLVAMALAAAPLDGSDTSGSTCVRGPVASRRCWLRWSMSGTAELTAVEPLQHRAELVRANLRAVPGEHQVLVGDGTKPTWPAGWFDRVLADVPCSGLGALRRRPEARWRRTPEDINELRPLQERLLDSAHQLGPAGRSGRVRDVLAASARDA